ncbi:IclR family transcriptional regulator [Hoyosella subflava]|uniref:Putative IclR family transcriptional regulator n=1 Tax=Hoyosella subflava (strain DSM 45089 / JCM 17490 / NBRC 109087 / DQS3-9A1) TaxID=443218 RepID=F6EPM5_HOYSD|nr:IclR family transcriptional regulator [Hoyosella subflava]AEF39458.1 Putative IclR family transcriptional regulator [Hoyosella subflava DQS3-9A1]
MTEIAGDGDTRTASAVQSVDRALVILEIVARLGEARVTDVAAELGVHKSTASRLISALESRGYLAQAHNRGRVQLGRSIVRLARSADTDGDLVRHSQQFCTNLAEEVGETVNVSVREGDRAVCVVKADGPSGVAAYTWVGQSGPAYATSSGKLLLAELPEAELHECLAAGLTALTPQTVTDMSELTRVLKFVRARGWAESEEELEAGLNAVSAPIYDHTAKVIAALSVSGPAYRLKAEDFEPVARSAQAVAAQISNRLGYQSA